MHQEGDVGAWLTQTQGRSSPHSFHGVDGNSRTDQGRANLEEMMVHSLQPGAIVWDELLACPASLEEKPPGPQPLTIMHQLQGVYLTGRRKERLVFARKTPRVCIRHTCPSAEPRVQAQALLQRKDTRNKSRTEGNIAAESFCKWQ